MEKIGLKRINTMRVLCFLISLALFCSCERNKRPNFKQEITLNGEWRVSSPDTSIEIMGRVPGTIHTDLLNAGIIDDPFYGCNEDSLAWIDHMQWVYEKEIFLEKDFLMLDSVYMLFNGLDTRAKVLVNDEEVLFADNMFRTWEVDVRDYLKAGGNKIRIIFFPVEAYNQQMADTLGYVLPDNRVFTRKAAYHSGWDWGPKFETCGIWRDAMLLGYSGVHIKSANIVTKRIEDNLAQMQLCLNLKSSFRNITELTIIQTVDKDTLFVHNIEVQEGENRNVVDFSITNPELWWCNGLGKPNLYHTMLRIYAGGNTIDSIPISFGVRQVKLVNKPDSIGESFYFELNGKPVFVKGANYIPMDNFIPRINEKKVDNLLSMACDANMNMIRVWGGGVYESNAFYNLCDEKGLMVWQDFMFACALYPVNDGFLRNINKELNDNISRIGWHPCIALWCGNNEVWNGWEDWGWQKAFGYSENDSINVQNDYKKLFKSKIPEVIDSYDLGIDYWPSSPEYGWGHKESFTHGDSHYWGVWWGEEPFSVWKEKTGRFMSEYGFQAFPDKNTLNKVGVDNNGEPLSILESHQKHPRGFTLIEKYMRQEYPVPQKFMDYIYMSQLVQAEGISKAILAHRSSAKCMGSLYWQLNDCWPVVSWSSIDYNNTPKALHYYVKQAFSSVIFALSDTGNGLVGHLISDHLKTHDFEISVDLKSMKGDLLASERIQKKMEYRTSVELKLKKINQALKQFERRDCYVQYKITNEGEQSEGSYLLEIPKRCNLLQPKIDIDCQQESDDVIVRLRSDCYVKSVYLYDKEKDLNMSDNYFNIFPGQTKSIVIKNVEKENLKLQYIHLNQFCNE
ncbi:MAG: beta-mannosidase [Marinilabiliales bacterium]|nr:MAG: beta-mannosidase [Marinilabiliales bacterium]